MKAEERRVKELVLRAWERVLETLNRIGPESDAPEHLDAYGSVKDYVLDRIQDCEDSLTKAARDRAEKRGKKPLLLRPKGNGLHAGDNPLDNAGRSGVDNA